jgi:hypothetical protein
MSQPLTHPFTWLSFHDISFPIVVFVTITINLFFILFKSNNIMSMTTVIALFSGILGRWRSRTYYLVHCHHLKVRVTREQEEHAATVLDVNIRKLQRYEV